MCFTSKCKNRVGHLEKLNEPHDDGDRYKYFNYYLSHVHLGLCFFLKTWVALRLSINDIKYLCYSTLCPYCIIFL